MRIRSKLCVLASALVLFSIAANAGDFSSDSNLERSVAPKSFQIRNKKYGELLRPEDASNATGARIVLNPGQPWRCMTWKFYPAGESVFQLQNRFTSKTLASDPYADGAQIPVTQVPFSKQAPERPKWRFTKLPDGFYQITEVKSGKTLTAVPSEIGRVRIMVMEWAQTDRQKWELIKIDADSLTM